MDLYRSGCVPDGKKEALSQYGGNMNRLFALEFFTGFRCIVQQIGKEHDHIRYIQWLPIEGKKVVCVISGGNIDVNILSRVITRGLVMSGRKANLTIALEDKPGQLQRVAEIVSRCGSNVVSVLHDGSDPNMPISSCFLKLTLETRDAAQIEQIRAELTKEGFQLVSERV